MESCLNSYPSVQNCEFVRFENLIPKDQAIPNRVLALRLEGELVDGGFYRTFAKQNKRQSLAANLMKCLAKNVASDDGIQVCDIIAHRESPLK